MIALAIFIRCSQVHCFTTSISIAGYKCHYCYYHPQLFPYLGPDILGNQPNHPQLILFLIAAASCDCQ